MSNLVSLAEKTKNTVDSQIASIIQRPANIGHVGEHIAAEVFRIKLEDVQSNHEVHFYKRRT